jgi:WhiB family redox-sensing transcriptional regulator
VLNEPQIQNTSLTASHQLDATMQAPLLAGRARCSDGAGTLAHLFFSDDDLDVARAKAICRTCALSAECLESALMRSEAYGVWGGTLLIDGEPVRFARRRGRPPTHRIETVAEEVPIPEHLVA